jgi:hypothetical protein
MTYFQDGVRVSIRKADYNLHSDKKLNKNRGTNAAIFEARKSVLRRRLGQRTDALGAKSLLDQAALFQNADLLQIRFELAIGGAL